jgi:ribosome-binding factor A
MDSTRQLKYARLIQKELGDIFIKEGRNYFGSSFITITKTKVTPDLSIARVYLSTFRENGDDVLKKVNLHKNEIRHQLGTRIKNQARIIPNLEFFIDDSLDYAEKMEKVFSKLDIPPDETPSDQ